MPKGAQRHHQLRLFHCGERLLRIMRVEFGFDTEQQISLERIPEHCLRVLARSRAKRYCACNISTDTVRRLAKKSAARARDFRQSLRQRVQL